MVQFFDDIKVMGSLSALEQARKLHAMGDKETAAKLVRSARDDQGWQSESRFGSGFRFWKPKLWQHTSHTFGFVHPKVTDTEGVKISHAASIPADLSLSGKQIKITLDGLQVAEYPGIGIHHILFDFYAQNQTATNVEHLHLNSLYTLRDGEQAAVLGHPLFLGLNVGLEGVALRCMTVNVKNQSDYSYLRFLESDIFRAGLRLLDTAQPAVKLLSTATESLTKAIAKRTDNVPVQKFSLGLDFSESSTGARLSEGTYLVVQVPDSIEVIWDWSEWTYMPQSGRVVSRLEPGVALPYNYIMLGLTRMQS